MSLQQGLAQLGIVLRRKRSLAASSVSQEAEARRAQGLRAASRVPPSELLAQLGTAPAGLTEEAAAQRLEEHGLNQVSHEKPPRWYVQLYHAFRNPFVVLLVLLAGVSLATDDLPGTVIITVMVLASALLRFFQERRSTVAAERLKAMVKVTATVLRQDESGSVAREVPIEQLVPGDVVRLSAGDMVPADVRLLTAKDLFISQAVLTGESLPVEKFVQVEGAPGASPLELLNLCFLGTNVVSGSATAVVVHTGEGTYLGALSQKVVGTRSLTSFEKGVQGVSYLLIRFMVVMTLLVFFINGLMKHDWNQAFLFALSVAVGLTPEMLPMIVSGTLALGAVAMSRKKVIVKQLNAIQNIGAIDVLCTDKTGTLTQDKVILEWYCDPVREEDEDVFRYAYLNSHFQTGLKNLLDKAVLAHPKQPFAVEAKKVDEIPFDFSRRMMSVVVEDQGVRRLITKGAPEAVIARCSRFQLGGEVLELGDGLVLPELREELDKLSGDGFRVLAIAYKEVPEGVESFSRQDESDLILKGYVAFLDPPKESAAQAIAALGQHGVGVKILTGDNDIVTRTVCHQVGLPVERVVLGSEVEAMDDATLADAAESVTVFARLTPSHKERVVRALRGRGHVVGFMGDGINDAPALRAADVGISVDNAVDIAKESADLILLEKSLLVLEDGVLEGRRVFGNISKYIKMGTSSNFGNMFSVLGASLLLPFLPMLPLQLLVQNLLYDFSQVAIPFDRVDDEYLRHPRQWRIKEISRFMIFIGPISSVFDYTTYALMYFVFKANSPERQALFQTGWFVEGLLSQTLIVHMIRTWKIPFLQSRAALPLILTTLAIMTLGVCLPYTAAGHIIKLVPLPSRYFAFLSATLLTYALLTQMVKTWFARRFGDA